ncbi:hypothetical protein SS05631_a48390 (plasmid) [Sinorhizobium sp. CCBAU 05631]|nr:hypothetical protein SS05631_a48390 [Sinorhizobium sp. CCBAU 05631]
MPSLWVWQAATDKVTDMSDLWKVADGRIPVIASVLEPSGGDKRVAVATFQCPPRLVGKDFRNRPGGSGG